MLELETERLRLLALTTAQLECYLLHAADLAEELGVTLSQAVLKPPVPRAIGMKIEKMAQSPRATHPWYTYWLMVIKADDYGAGLLGFKGSPSPAGEVEIGYGIDPAYQRRGYTTEAVSALLNWALAQPGCGAVLAWVNRENAASIRVLEKVGMRQFGIREDRLFWRITGRMVAKKRPFPQRL